MSNSKHVLVTGATGQQGGALAHQLLERGHRVRALTRTPDSGAAGSLAAAGASLAYGDFDDPDSLVRAARGVDAVFAMSAFWGVGTQAEVRQGVAVVDAAVAAGVEHFVFTSVASADRGTAVPHFESKYRIERHLVASELPYTIIRPAYFMENALTFGAQALADGKLAVALSPDRRLQQVSVADIGRFAAVVIEDRGRFAGLVVDIAGDEVTGVEAAHLITKVTGVPIGYEEIPLAGIRGVSEELAAMYEFFERVGMDVDVDALRREYPEVGWTRYEDWVAEQDWQALLGQVLQGATPQA